MSDTDRYEAASNTVVDAIGVLAIAMVRNEGSTVLAAQAQAVEALSKALSVLQTRA